GLVAAPPPADHVTERQAAALNRLRADCLLPTAARVALDFSVAGTPSVSVIMLLRDQFALTLMTLASLRAAYGGAIELILLDAGSSDDTRRIGHFVLGALLLRFDSELDVVRSRNAALNCVTADTVLFLDSAVE